MKDKTFIKGDVVCLKKDVDNKGLYPYVIHKKKKQICTLVGYDSFDKIDVNETEVIGFTEAFLGLWDFNLKK